MKYLLNKLQVDKRPNRSLPSPQPSPMGGGGGFSPLPAGEGQGEGPGKAWLGLISPSRISAGIAKILFLATASALAGCANVPDTDIKHPLTTRPSAPVAAAQNNGAIFQDGPSRARPGLGLFEDRRARRVGDVLTVNLVEKTEAKRKSETTDERKANGSIDIPGPMILGRGPVVGATTWEPSAGNKIELKDNETNSNEIKGAITVTVIEVLDNGNLLVAGEKQVRINQDTEYIRLAGVVNPSQITVNNTVNSTQLADVQLESTNSQRFDRSQFAGILARFFLTVLPF